MKKKTMKVLFSLLVASLLLGTFGFAEDITLNKSNIEEYCGCPSQNGSDCDLRQKTEVYCWSSEGAQCDDPLKTYFDEFSCSSEHPTGGGTDPGWGGGGTDPGWGGGGTDPGWGGGGTDPGGGGNNGKCMKIYCPTKGGVLPCKGGQNAIAYEDFSYSSGIPSNKCDFHKDKIKKIDDNVFEYYAHLHDLDLSNHKLSTITENAFKHLKQVDLNLAGNKIESIAPGAFSGLTTLNSSLNLSNNLLTEIQDGTFEGLSSAGINLAGNKITTIAPGAFRGLDESIHGLNLSNNLLTEIKKGIFGNSYFTELKLNDNQISTIESGAFENIGSSVELDLSNNQLSKIEKGTFAGGGIGSLVLNNNQISTIESGAFANIYSTLHTLNLSNNKIDKIKKGMFEGTNALSISLLRNNITSIESGGFDGLEKLKYLNLVGNYLTTVAKDTFSTLNNLQTLDLSNNQITKIAIGSFDNFVGSNIGIENNCLDRGGTELMTYFSSHPKNFLIPQSSIQYVCPTITYDKTTSTAGVVKGTLSFVGGTAEQRAQLANANTGFFGYTWTGNGEHTFGFTGTASETESIFTLSGIIGNLHPIYYDPLQRFGYDIPSLKISKIVNWISEVPPTINPINNQTIQIGAAIQDIVLSGIDLQSPTIITVIGLPAGVKYFSGTRTIAGTPTNIGTYSIKLEAKDVANTTGTNQFTIIVNAKPNPVSSSSGGGGGGGSSLRKDSCPHGDNSPSYYDGTCEKKEEKEEKEVRKTEQNEKLEIETQEKVHGSAKEEKVNISFQGITRKDMSKIITLLMENVLEKKEEVIKDECVFDDISHLSFQEQKYIKQGCKLGVMGLDKYQKQQLKSFSPNKILTKKEFMTILSRVLRGEKYASNEGEVFYENHIQGLKSTGIMWYFEDLWNKSPEVLGLKSL